MASQADSERRNIAMQKVKERKWPEPYGKPTDIDCIIGLEKIRNRRFYQITRPETESIFEYFDLDKDKYISVFEIKALLDIACTVEDNQGNVTMDEGLIDELDVIFGQGDSSGDGVIDMDEFLQAMKLSSSADAAKTTLRSAEPRRHAWAKRKNVILYLDASFAQAEACQSLPFYVVFFCLSFYLVVNHLRILSGYNEVQLGKSAWVLPDDDNEAWNPGNIKGMWSIQKLPQGDDESYTPLWWASGDLLQNRLNFADNHPFRGRVSNYQQIVGGLLFTKSDAPEKRCRDPELEALYLPSKLAGYDTMTRSGGWTTPSPPALDKLCLDMENPEDETWFLASTDQLSLARMTADIENKAGAHWLNRKTVKLEITAFTYNADNGYFQLNTISFELTAGGSVDVEYSFQNFLAKPYDSKGVNGYILWILDVVWMGMVAYVFLRESLNVLGDIRRLGAKKGLGMYLAFYNLVDWFNIIMSILIVTNWRGILQYLDGLERTLLDRPAFSFGDILLEEWTVEIHRQAGVIAAQYMTLKWRISIFAASTMLSFFKAFRANPRLDVVAKTLSGASMDLAHFLIVFATIFYVFVLVGHFLFGPSVREFSTITKAQNSCFLCMMGFLYDDIADATREEAGNLATIYWLLFFVVIAVLLMNMILAIIFDVYTEVKNDAGDAAYLWTQVIEAIQYQKKRLALLKDAANYVTTMVDDAALGGKLGKMGIGEEKVHESNKPLDRRWLLRQLTERSAHEDDIMTPNSMGKTWEAKFNLASATLLLKDVEEFVRHLRVKADVDVDDVMRVLGRMDMNIRDMMARARFEFGDPLLVARKTQQFENEIDYILKKMGHNPDQIAAQANALNKQPKTLGQLEQSFGMMEENGYESGMLNNQTGFMATVVEEEDEGGSSSPKNRKNRNSNEDGAGLQGRATNKNNTVVSKKKW